MRITRTHAHLPFAIPLFGESTADGAALLADLELDPQKAKDKGEWCLLTVLQRLRMLDA